MAFRRPPHVPRCPFCERVLPDLMLGFLDHVDVAPGCKAAWTDWRMNVRREAGGT